MVFTALMFWAIGGSRFTIVDAPRLFDLASVVAKLKARAGWDLRGQVRKMRDIQIVLLYETKLLDSRFAGNEQEKSRSKNDLLELARKQEQVTREAESIIRSSKGENANNAVSGLLELVRLDSEALRSRILKGDIGQDTQSIEKDMAEYLDLLTLGLQPACGGCP